MTQTNEAVPVAAKTLRIHLSDGGYAQVRRLSRSEQCRLQAAFGASPTVPSQAGLYMEAVVRAALTGGSAVALDGQSIEPIVPETQPTERVEGVGRLARREYFDAITDVDAVAIFRFAASGLTPEQAKKSEPSPDGPRPSEKAGT